VRAAVFVVPLKVAEMVTVVSALGLCVLTVKVALVEPAATVTLDGTVATVLLLEVVTTAPPAGAAALSVTVPVEELPPLTLLGLRMSEASVTLPLPLHTLLMQLWPAEQVPQFNVPPQALEALPQLKPSDEHVLGVQGPALIVRFPPGS
jgi:hypothetical protein